MPDKPKAPQGKKLPKWVIPAGAVTVVAIVLYLRKKSSSTEGNATEPGTSGLSNQSFIPVTGENVAGMGSGGGSGGGTVEGSSNNEEALRELIKGNQEANKESQQESRAFFEKALERLGTGGGAPSSPAAQGGVTAPPPESQPAQQQRTPSPTPAPKPVPKPAGCPSSHPNSGPHGCFQNMTCGNGCAGHRYVNGTTECQTKTGGKCHW